MQAKAVESVTLATVAYDVPAGRLQLEFRTGHLYHYFGVPPQVFEGLMQASSKGKYFNRDIRGRFPYTLLPSRSNRS
jgi:hypothetical protein